MWEILVPLLFIGMVLYALHKIGVIDFIRGILKF